MQLFDGKAASKKIEEEIAEKIQTRRTELPQLLAIQIGDNAESEKYVNLKLNLAQRLGIYMVYKKIEPHLTKPEIVERVQDMFNMDGVGGGIIQLPLPSEELNSVLDLIPIEKDLDLLSGKSQEKFYSGNFSRVPPVVQAVRYFMEENQLYPKDMKIYVIGGGFLVGRPVAFYLQSFGARVEVVENYARGRKLDCSLAILSAGIPNLVDGADLPTGCNVIDFGSSIVDGRTVGDLDMNTKTDHLGIVSPSPGGMGPLVVRFLMKNFVDFVS